MHPHAATLLAAFVIPQVAYLAFLRDVNPAVSLLNTMLVGVVAPPKVEWWALAVVAAFSLERLLYAYVWLNPATWMKFCEKFPSSSGTPWEILGRTLPLNKIIQLSSLVLVHVVTGGLRAYPVTPAGAVDYYAVMTAAQLFLIGQYLNWAVYHALGKKGVYYGCRLGAKVPWCEGAPFTCCAHPQYVGAILSIMALGIMVTSPWHGDHGLWLAFFLVFALYGTTMYVEDHM